MPSEDFSRGPGPLHNSHSMDPTTSPLTNSMGGVESPGRGVIDGVPSLERPPPEHDMRMMVGMGYAGAGGHPAYYGGPAPHYITPHTALEAPKGGPGHYPPPHMQYGGGGAGGYNHFPMHHGYPPSQQQAPAHVGAGGPPPPYGGSMSYGGQPSYGQQQPPSSFGYGGAAAGGRPPHWYVGVYDPPPLSAAHAPPHHAQAPHYPSQQPRTSPSKGSTGGGAPASQASSVSSRSTRGGHSGLPSAPSASGQVVGGSDLVVGKQSSPDKSGIKLEDDSTMSKKVEEMEAERLKAAAAAELSLAEVKPIQTAFHFFVLENREGMLLQLAEEEVRRSMKLDSSTELDPYFVNSNLNSRLMKAWEDMGSEERDSYVQREEDDRVRFMEEDEVASRHCFTLTARLRSPAKSKLDEQVFQLKGNEGGKSRKGGDGNTRSGRHAGSKKSHSSGLSAKGRNDDEAEYPEDDYPDDDDFHDGGSKRLPDDSLLHDDESPSKKNKSDEAPDDEYDEEEV